MITLRTYWMGRDATHAEELTDEINRNARITVDKANELLERAGRSDIDQVASGWRPASVNDVTQNAARSSRHLTAEAVDLPDLDRTLAGWIVDNLDVLKEIGLWVEDFRWTWSENGNHWVHLQIVPPKSGKLVFIPNSTPPKDKSFEVT